MSIIMVPRWKVTVSFQLRNPHSFYISDNHIENVLRIVGSMSFSETPLEQPEQITIERWGR